jgi:hypothetical protein
VREQWPQTFCLSWTLRQHSGITPSEYCVNQSNESRMTGCIGILYSDSEFMDLTGFLILAPPVLLLVLVPSAPGIIDSGPVSTDSSVARATEKSLRNRLDQDSTPWEFLGPSDFSMILLLY